MGVLRPYKLRFSRYLRLAMAERVTNGRTTDRANRSSFVVSAVEYGEEQRFFIIIQNSKAELGSG